eukprot:IDg2218t1
MDDEVTDVGVPIDSPDETMIEDNGTDISEGADVMTLSRISEMIGNMANTIAEQSLSIDALKNDLVKSKGVKLISSGCRCSSSTRRESNCRNMSDDVQVTDAIGLEGTKLRDLPGTL